MADQTEEFKRVWSVSDYGNIAAIGVGSGAAATGSPRLFGTDLPQGTSTITKDNKIKPSPANQKQAQDVLRDPKGFVQTNANAQAQEESILDKSKTLLANLFNTEDEADLQVGPVNLSGVESVWDGMLKGFMWGYDRINQVTVAGLSGLPGGTPTLTWDQAGEISVGQEIIANVGASVGRARRGEGTLGDIIMGAGSAPLTAIGMLAPENTPTQQANFDITDPNDRRVFESGWEKFGSGSLDTAFTLFADPLIVGGKALKIARLKYIDSPIIVADNRLARINELADGERLIAEGRVDELAPIAKFAYDAVTPAADGSRMSGRRLQMRGELGDSFYAEDIGEALATLPNGDYATARLVMGAAVGDEASIAALASKSVIALDTLNAAKRQRLMLEVQANPEVLVRETQKLDEAITASSEVYEMQKKALSEGRVTQTSVDEAYKILDNNLTARQALEEGTLPDPYSLATTDQTIEMLDRTIAELKAREEWFSRAIAANFKGALLGADKGFSPNNPLGRVVSKRRDAIAEAKYQRKMTSGQEWKSQDYFGASRFRRTVRLFARPWDESPSYYVGVAGDAAINQGREVEAYLDSLDYLGNGKTFNILDEQGNIVRTVDGITRKNELYSMYVQARGDRDVTSLALDNIQKEIIKDIGSIYGLDRATIEHVQEKMFSTYNDLKEQLIGTEDGAFFDKSNEILSVAPFLRSQLNQGMYMMPVNRFEQIAKDIASGKIKDPYAPVVATKGQIVASKIIAADALFQDLWRPAVLFRLGYPQRNVAEGLFRSIVFNSSLSPLLWAGKAGYIGAKNFRKAQRASKRALEAENLLKKPDASRDAFDALVKQQRGIQERERELFGARNIMVEEEKARLAANTLPTVEFADDPLGFVSTDGAYRVQRFVKETDPAVAPPTRFKTLNKDTGELQFGDMRISPTSDNKWIVQTPSGSTVISSKNGAKNFAKEQQALLDAARGPGAPVRVETWRVMQLDPINNTFVAGKRIFTSPDDAKAALNADIARSFGSKGREAAGNPQLNIVVENGRKARAKIVKPYKNMDDKTFRSVNQIDAELQTLATDGAKVKADIDAIGSRPIPAAMKGTRFQTWRENQLTAMEEEIVSLKSFKDVFLKANAELSGADEKSVFALLDVTDQQKLIMLDQNVDDLSARIVAMERDDYFALGEYQKQSSAKLRADNSTKIDNLPFGITIESAFGNPRNADLRFNNMSSNNTMRATLAARMQLADSVLYKIKMKNYVEVYPKDGEAYWQGMSDMLRQYAVDNMGQMIINGRSDQDIAMWLLSSSGKSTQRALDDAWAFYNNYDEAIPPRIGNDMNRALAFVAEVRSGLNQITAGKTEVWDMLRSGAPSPEQLKRVLQGNPALGPVIGHTTELTGIESTINIYRKLTRKAFEWIGTMPEDAFVRGPFYANRYEVTRAAQMDYLERYYGSVEKIPLQAIYDADSIAAKRALKDTKDFLYTIDRRTNLGKYGESIFPFISATQNSITSIGRLTRRDPALPGMMLALWQAPTKMGWEDEKGNLIIPLPMQLLPSGVKDFFGIDNATQVSVPKSALNVIFPETGYAFAPRPSAPIQVAASELMKKGFLGFSVEAPPVLVSFMGQKDADSLWQQVKNYAFGEESGISSEFASYDKVLPPIANKLIEYIQKDGSSQYGYQYALQAKTEALKWWAGERDDYPEPDEIIKRTNGMFLLRMLGNAFAFTPPAYDSAVQPLIDMQRTYDKLYGIEGPMKFSENFGQVLLTIGNTASTMNIGGATSSADAVRNIKKYDSLIRELTPNMSDENLDILGILVNSDPKNSVYDTSAYRWLTTTNIPGTTRQWREVNSGAKAEAEVQRQAFWVEYMKFIGQLDALRQQRGLKSYRVKGAEQLNSYRKEFIENMRANPLYQAGVTDFESMGSSKTYEAVRVITAAVNDPDFMSDKADNPTWQAALLYLDTRQRLIKLVSDSGKSLSSKDNAALAADWDTFRNELIDKDAGWAAIANRYLNGDDVPKELGASFTDTGV
jgi:hypothetical protein